MSDRPRVLVVGAIDPRGLEGIAADALVLDEIGCRPLFVPTSLVSAEEGGGFRLEPTPASFWEEGFRVAAAERATAARVGLLPGLDAVRRLAGRLAAAAIPDLVLAPVARAGGRRLLDDAALAEMRERIFPLARVVVVRAVEAGLPGAREPETIDEAVAAAAALRASGAPAALVSGLVHRSRIVDVLDDGEGPVVLDAARSVGPRLVGLAGAHAAALAAHLARGHDLRSAARAAQRYVGLRLARGR